MGLLILIAGISCATAINLDLETETKVIDVDSILNSIKNGTEFIVIEAMKNQFGNSKQLESQSIFEQKMAITYDSGISMEINENPSIMDFTKQLEEFYKMHIDPNLENGTQRHNPYSGPTIEEIDIVEPWNETNITLEDNVTVSQPKEIKPYNIEKEGNKIYYSANGPDFGTYPNLDSMPKGPVFPFYPNLSSPLI